MTCPAVPAAPDPFGWLEEIHAPKALAWVEDENKRMRLLQAEVAHLEEPARLVRLSSELGLAPTSARRQGSSEELGDIARDALLPRADSLDSGRRRRQRRQTRNREPQRGRTDRRLVEARILAERRVDDELNLSGLHAVHRVGSALVDLEHVLGRDARLPQGLARALRGAEGEAQVRELANAQSGSLYPQLAITGGIGRQRYGAQFLGSFTPPPPFTYYALGPTVSYALDYTGGTARSVEQQYALAEYQRQQLNAAYLMVTGNAVLQSLRIAQLQGEIATVEAILEEDRQNKKLVEVAFGVALPGGHSLRKPGAFLLGILYFDLDKDKNGTVTRDEFIAGYWNKEKGAELFKEWDTDGDGVLTLAEATAVPEMFTNNVCAEFLKFDADLDGLDVLLDVHEAR